MQYDTSLSRRENFIRNIGINVPDHIENGVIIANELIDNLPFDLWAHLIENAV